MVDWITNEAPKWLVMVIWLGANAVLFGVTYVRYRDAEEYYYLHYLVGNSLCWARGSAACLNLNVMLILLPVCRKLITFIRGSCMCCPGFLRRQLDKNIMYHKYIAYMICFHTLIHISAHCFNFERFVESKDATDPRGVISSWPISPDGTWVNPIRVSNPDATKELFKTVAGISGVIITLALILILSSSTEIIRRSYFELFWYTHHLFIIFFIGFVVHGTQMIIRKQTNLEAHPPKICLERNNCPDPHFEGSSPTSWIWLVVPAVIYLIERIARLASGLRRVVITKVVNHPSRVYELQLKKKGFSAGPGQYVVIQCPSVSKLEWHPFTLTSAPQDDYFSVHIRRVGDWTNAVAKLCHVEEGEFQEAWKMPRIYVDGPFGTASEDVFMYDVAVLIGCGIGITPFASVLKAIWYKVSQQKDSIPLEKVHLYWVCPDTSAFEWFKELLLNLEREMRQKNCPDFLKYNIYLTRGWDANQARTIMMHDDYSQYDAITGLHQKTFYGRPQWEDAFKELAESHKGKQTGVFFCGPKALSTVLHKLCNRHSKTETSTKFFYNKENF